MPEELQPVVYVPSLSEKDKVYMVVRPWGDNGWYCNCPAFRFHKGNNPGSVEVPTCKHIKTTLEKDSSSE